MAQIHLTTKNEMNVIGYISFLIKNKVLSAVIAEMSSKRHQIGLVTIYQSYDHSSRPYNCLRAFLATVYD